MSSKAISTALMLGTSAALVGAGLYLSDTARATIPIGQQEHAAPSNLLRASVEPDFLKDAPSFELVRALRNGRVEILGRAGAGAMVEITSAGRTLGTAKADANGKFRFASELPVAAGLTFRLRVEDRLSDDKAIIEKAADGMEPLVFIVPADDSGVATRGQGEDTTPDAEENSERPADASSNIAPENAEAPPSNGSSDVAPGGKTALQLKPAKPEAQRIRIRWGDTLWDIAEHTYGGGWRYPRIVRANRQKIDDPDLIYVGQIFTLPRPYANAISGLRPSS